MAEEELIEKYTKEKVEKAAEIVKV